MKILLADKFPEEKIKKLEQTGCEVIYEQNLKEETLVDALKKEKPEILIVRSTMVNKQMIENSPELNLIIRAGSGVNTIDVKTASERSVYVSNCPGMNSTAVAELAFGLILSIDRRIPDNVIELRKGKWNKKEYSKARGIYGRTLGIIGTGKIGKKMIQKAKAFEMKVIAWSRSLTPEKAEQLGVEYCNSVMDVARRADIVSVHLALTGETKGILGRDFFNSMKPGAYFINTARAELVDEEALLRAIDERGIRAGVDVFKEEPEEKEGEIRSRLASHPGVYGTHHIGASTEQAQNAVAEETVRIVKDFIETGKPPNCVNLMKRTPACCMLSLHHRNRVGVLAGVLDVIRDAGINIETMENIIFAGGEGACARIQMDGKLSGDDILKIRDSSKDIFFVTQVDFEKTQI